MNQICQEEMPRKNIVRIGLLARLFQDLKLSLLFKYSIIFISDDRSPFCLYFSIRSNSAFIISFRVPESVPWEWTTLSNQGSEVPV